MDFILVEGPGLIQVDGSGFILVGTPDVAIPVTAAAEVTDHVAEGIALFIDQYKNKPRLTALLTAFLNRCNELESALNQILTMRDLDVATGVQLDVIGKLVGQVRISTDDDIYRLFIRTKIRSNRSQGQSADVIDVMRIALATADIRVTDYYPASVVAEVISALSPLGVSLMPFLFGILMDTKGSGVALSLHYTDEDNVFTLSDTDLEVLDANLGLANNAGTTGGHLPGAF